MGLRRREHVTRETTLDTPYRPATALFTIDDYWWVATLASVSDAFTGVTMDSTPPVRAVHANLETLFGNPFAAPLFHDPWYDAQCAAR